MQQVMLSVRDLRDTFLRSLSAATTSRDIAATCFTFKRSIDSWLKDLSVVMMRQNGANLRARKGTRLELKHRVNTFTYPAALKSLGENPSNGGLVRVRMALKELWCVLNLDD